MITGCPKPGADDLLLGVLENAVTYPGCESDRTDCPVPENPFGQVVTVVFTLKKVIGCSHIAISFFCRSMAVKAFNKNYLMIVNLHVYSMGQTTMCRALQWDKHISIDYDGTPDARSSQRSLSRLLQLTLHPSP